MKKFNVEYLIDDEDYERLMTIMEIAKKDGFETTPENMFSLIMTCVAKFDVNQKFDFCEELGMEDIYSSLKKQSEASKNTGNTRKRGWEKEADYEV